MPAEVEGSAMLLDVWFGWLLLSLLLGLPDVEAASSGDDLPAKDERIDCRKAEMVTVCLLYRCELAVVVRYLSLLVSSLFVNNGKTRSDHLEILKMMVPVKSMALG